MAIRQGYQDTPTQILQKEDVALVIKGNKITDDISQPLRFHSSRETARKHLTTKKWKPWMQECFDEIDWHNLDLAQKNKADMFIIRRAKQISGFCRSRVQVGRYSGEQYPDEKCPNCGQRETSDHLMICPDTDSKRLLKEQTNELSKWLDHDNKTEP